MPVCKIVNYERSKDKITGIPAEKKGYIYKHIDYNEFEKVPTKIPNGFKKKKLPKAWIEEFGCGDKKRIDEVKFNKSIHKGYKTYFTHDNGGRPFLVCIKGKVVKVFMIEYIVPDDFDVKKYHYSKLIKEYEPEKIFIGKSPKNKTNECGCGYGKQFDGNSILLELKKNRYVFIGDCVYEFTPEDKIMSYFSPVGANDVPYPFALGEKNVYFMLSSNYVQLQR